MIPRFENARICQVFAAAALALGLVAALVDIDALTIALLLTALILIVLGGPVTSLITVVACLPLWMLEIPVRGTIWSPLELALLAAGATTGAWVLVATVRRRSIAPISEWLPPVDILAAAAVLVVVAAFSLWTVAEPDLRPDSIRAFRRVIVEPLLVLPVAVFVLRNGRFRTVIPWIAATALAVSALAIAQVVLGRSTVDIGGFSRPTGPFTHPNNLAFFIERAIWFVPLALMAATRDRRILWTAIAVCALAVVLTLSRGSALAVMLGALVFGWNTARRHWTQTALAGVALAAFVFAARFLAETGDSVGSRLDIWRSSITMLRDHPVTGVGLDQFLGQYGTRYVLPEGWVERYTSHPHNILLDFWLSLGIGGLIVLWLFGESLYTRVRVAIADPDWTLRRAAVALLVAGLAHGLVDNSFFLPDLATWTWLGLAIAWPGANADE